MHTNFFKVVAVMLIETSMHTSSLVGVDSALHAGFPDDPDAEYITQGEMI